MREKNGAFPLVGLAVFARLVPPYFLQFLLKQSCRPRVVRLRARRARGRPCGRRRCSPPSGRPAGGSRRRNSAGRNRKGRLPCLPAHPADNGKGRPQGRPRPSARGLAASPDAERPRPAKGGAALVSRGGAISGSPARGGGRPRRRGRRRLKRLTKLKNMVRFVQFFFETVNAFIMELLFASKKLQKQFSAQKELNRCFGQVVAKRIMQRLMEMSAATTLQDLSHLPPPRCHELTNREPPTFSVDVSANLRLLFTPKPPIQRSPDNRIDRTKVLSVIILEVADTHDGKVRR